VTGEVGEKCSVQQLIRHGDIVGEIITQSRELGADLIVVGVKHRLFTDESFGRKTTEIIRDAACPVIAVPATSLTTRES
jgi:nucleotide-binding universal stress UspA family protein